MAEGPSGCIMEAGTGTTSWNRGVGNTEHGTGLFFVIIIIIYQILPSDLTTEHNEIV